MALATLSIDLVAQLGSLQAGLDKAGRLAERNAAAIEARYAKMAQVAGSVGAALAGAISVAGITAFVRATVDGIDKLNDLADATGASIENLSALEDIGARTGTSMETVGDAVIKLNKVLSDAKPGTDQAAVLKAIGLSAEELKRQDPAEAVRTVAQALAGFADDGTKARYVQELFGKSTKDVAAFLKDLAGAGELNATVTTKQAKEAERFNQQLAALSKNVKDASRSLVGDMLPALNQFFERLNGNRKAGGFFASIGQEIKANLASDSLRVVVAEIESIQATIDRQGATPALAKRMAALREEAAQLSREAQAASEKLKGFADVAKPVQEGRRPVNEGGGGLRSRLLPDLPGDKPKTERPKPFISNSFDQGVQDALRELDKTDVSKVRELEAALSALFELQRETRGDPAVAQAIGNVRDEIASLGPEAKKAAEEKKRLDAILAATPQGVLQDVLTDIELINRAFDNGSKDTERWAAAIRVAVAKLPAETEKALEEISEFSREASRNIQDALGDSLLAMMEGNTKSIGELWVNMLKRMVAQAAAAQLAESLFGKGYGSSTNKLGGLFGAFGGGGGMFGSRGSFTGSSEWGTGSQWGNQDFGGFFAEGGYLGAGKWGIAGERGPEVIKGPAQVQPMQPGGSSNFNFTVNVQGDASANTLRLMERWGANFEARLRGGAR